jgi:hypothetical protein
MLLFLYIYLIGPLRGAWLHRLLHSLPIHQHVTRSRKTFSQLLELLHIGLNCIQFQQSGFDSFLNLKLKEISRDSTLLESLFMDSSLRSSFFTAANRGATTIAVFPCRNPSSDFCTTVLFRFRYRLSVSIGICAMIARPIHNRCFSPPLKLVCCRTVS